jgi:hypothetical protein
VNVAMQDALKKFAQTHEGTSYGEAAQNVFEKLSADTTAKLAPESFFVD